VTGGKPIADISESRVSAVNYLDINAGLIEYVPNTLYNALH
jgi:hypothetical protein